MALAAVNVSFLEAAIAIVAPVDGLLPSRAGLSLTLNLPKPGRLVSAPLTAASAIAFEHAIDDGFRLNLCHHGLAIRADPAPIGRSIHFIDRSIAPKTPGSVAGSDLSSTDTSLSGRARRNAKHAIVSVFITTDGRKRSAFDSKLPTASIWQTRHFVATASSLERGDTNLSRDT